MINSIFPVTSQRASHSTASAASNGTAVSKAQAAAAWVDDEIIWALVAGN